MASYVLNEEQMFSDIADGIAIVINSETGIYYGMNNLGTSVFENLLNGVSTENILGALKKLNGAPADMDERLSNFIALLLENGILIKGGGGDAPAAISAEAAAANNFALEVREYNDAQELLLADPIHEVKEDTGWQPDKSALETDEEVVKAKEDKAKE
ncbi:MAG: PqqD family protein [Spirochaetaceae bacterium]|jgi:hypothetical protein|nr:PqqD family protein [Spirochaetaceae bacterium]